MKFKHLLITITCLFSTTLFANGYTRDYEPSEELGKGPAQTITPTIDNEENQAHELARKVMEEYLSDMAKEKQALDATGSQWSNNQRSFSLM